MKELKYQNNTLANRLFSRVKNDDYDKSNIDAYKTNKKDDARILASSKHVGKNSNGNIVYRNHQQGTKEMKDIEIIK